jgi:DMSO/TMAO reductase YedYZ heme-binding membrane subunit
VKTLTIPQARAALRRKGYSYRRAALALGCSFTHLSHVLTHRRESRRLLGRIAELPESPVPYRRSGFAA